MSAKLEVKQQDLNLFGQNPSLLFQFILAEFLTTFQIVKEMEITYREMEALLIHRRLRSDVSHSLNQLLLYFNTLTGSAIINEQASPWDSQAGSLSKLRHYCYSFVNYHDSKEKAITNLNVCISKAFHSALQVREVILYHLHEEEKTKKIPDYATLYQLIDRVLDNINRTSRLILQIIVQYRGDENVVYFLLRNKEKFDSIYKTNLVGKVFRKMYPEGIQEVGQLLMKKYTERGFTNLLNNIAAKISELGKGS